MRIRGLPLERSLRRSVKIPCYKGYHRLLQDGTLWPGLAFPVKVLQMKCSYLIKGFSMLKSFRNQH